MVSNLLIQNSQFPFFFIYPVNQVVLNDVSLQSNFFLSNSLGHYPLQNISYSESFRYQHESIDWSKRLNIQESNQKKNLTSSIINQKKNQKKVQQFDEDYIPIYNQQKSYKNSQQNEKRNIVPNLIHQILTFVSKQEKSGSLVKKIIEKKGFQSILFTKYYQYVRNIKKKVSRYVNLKSFLRIVTSSSEKQIQPQAQEINIHQFNLITRILIRSYLKQQGVAATINSSKIKKQNRLYHFKEQRQILSAFLEYSPKGSTYSQSL